MALKHLFTAAIGTAACAAALLIGSDVDAAAAASATAGTQPAHAREYRTVAARRAHHARHLAALLKLEHERDTAKGKRGRGRWGGGRGGRGRGRR